MILPCQSKRVAQFNTAPFWISDCCNWLEWSLFTFLFECVDTCLWCRISYVLGSNIRKMVKIEYEISLASHSPYGEENRFIVKHFIFWQWIPLDSVLSMCHYNFWKGITWLKVAEYVSNSNSDGASSIDL